MHGTSSGLPVEIRVRQMYGRYLSAWAIDLMALRRQGLATPSSREADDVLVCPTTRAGEEVRWSTDGAAHLLAWRPTVAAAQAA